MEGTARGCVNSLSRDPCIWSAGCLPPLTESLLHVWIYDLDADRDSIALLEDSLSVDEWRRVRLFSSPVPARRFIVRRGVLRRTLGQYLNATPEDIRFVYNKHGKPFLAPELSSDLQFSLSDSGDLAALSVGISEPLGLDIERLRTVPLFSELEFGQPLLPEEEYPASSAAAARISAFLQAWTRREALAKAEGVGLQLLSGQFASDGLPDYAPPVSSEPSAPHGEGFHVHSLSLPLGYVGTVATRFKTPKVVYFSPLGVPPKEHFPRYCTGF